MTKFNINFWRKSDAFAIQEKKPFLMAGKNSCLLPTVIYWVPAMCQESQWGATTWRLHSSEGGGREADGWLPSKQINLKKNVKGASDRRYREHQNEGLENDWQSASRFMGREPGQTRSGQTRRRRRALRPLLRNIAIEMWALRIKQPSHSSNT